MLNEINYVHGYSEIEFKRLNDQANTLNDLLHHDSIFPMWSDVLEIGCGTGAQTEILCKLNPTSKFISVDISSESLNKAKLRCNDLGIKNVQFQLGDVFNLSFSKKSFDHIFVCFFLEHISDPDLALQKLKILLKPGGKLTIIEGDHGSAYYYPSSVYAQATIDCLVKIQSKNGGDALIGRRLFPLLKKNNFRSISILPRMIYADASKPHLVDGFTKKTFIAMVEGIRDQALKTNLITINDWERGIADLEKTAAEEGVFCYTFFKGVAGI